MDQFDRLKADLELMIDAYINLNESKNQEDLTKRLDSLKFDQNLELLYSTIDLKKCKKKDLMPLHNIIKNMQILRMHSVII